MSARVAVLAILTTVLSVACSEPEWEPNEFTIDADSGGAVGLSIVPGIYQTDGPAYEGVDCTYKRTGFGGERGSPEVLQEGSTRSGPVVIEVKGTDRMFESVGCLDWTPLRLDLDAPTPIYEGRYEVGVDVQPGWYRTAGVRRGQSRCSYLSSDGETAQQLKSTKKAASILIEPTHSTFYSNNCQPWIPSERE